jgi:hypothetical protein
MININFYYRFLNGPLFARRCRFSQECCFLDVCEVLLTVRKCVPRPDQNGWAFAIYSEFCKTTTAGAGVKSRFTFLVLGNT